MSDDGEQVRDLVDPDPFTVASVWLAGAALILQFLQTVKQFTPTQPTRPPSLEELQKSQRREVLTRLETELRDFKAHLKKISRAISRGAADPDKEFYDQRFRIGVGVLKLEFEAHQEYSQGLHYALAKVAGLSLWINQILEMHPDLTSTIGNRLVQEVSDSTQKLNNQIESGATNRLLIFEAQKVIDACERIVTQLLESN